jgi:ketosteroid isomerase-like protein
MPRAKATAALLSSPADVEVQFYEALREADLDKLMALWAEDEEVACVHPGGQRLLGLAAVRAGFEAMLSEGPLNLHAEVVARHVGLSFAVHSVNERVDVQTDEGPRSGWVLATNVYVNTTLGWRLLTHHASPGRLEEALAQLENTGLLH